MSQDLQDHLREVSQTVTLDSSNEVNRYLAVGWQLLSLATSPAAGGAINKEFYLAWPRDQGEPVYPMQSAAAFESDLDWAQRIASRVQPDPEEEARQVLARLPERLEVMIEALARVFLPTFRRLEELSVEQEGRTCALVVDGDQQLTFAVSKGRLVYFEGQWPEQPAARGPSARPVTRVRSRLSPNHDSLEEGAARVAHRFIEGLLGVGPTDPSNTDAGATPVVSGTADA